MGYNFLPCEREQLYLMPTLRCKDWLPEERLGVVHPGRGGLTTGGWSRMHWLSQDPSP
jgi:hypothetical protein